MRSLSLWIYRLPIFVVGVTAAMTGCTTVPLRSLPALTAIKFETTDLNVLRVGLRLPAGLEPRRSGVVLDVKVTMSGEPVQTSSFVLVPVEDVQELARLPGAARSGQRDFIFRLPEAEAARLNETRNRILTRNRQGQRGSLSMGIATREFCRSGPLMGGALLATTYVATSETGKYVVMTEDVDLRSEPAIAAGIASLKPCKPD